MTTLADIRTKVRRLTGRPSTNQITDAQIDSYVNTFYLYDLPERLQIFSLQSTFEFMTVPNQERYDLTTMTVVQNGVSDTASNVFINLRPPVYIAGYQSFWTQDNEEFYRMYPPLPEIITTVVGDGTPGPYAFTFNSSPILQNSVTVGTIDNTGATIQLIDDPQSRTSGNWLIINTETNVTGSVSYIAGTGTVTFSNNITTGTEITITGVPYVASRPQALKYYHNEISLQPVPDKVYKVSMNASITPTQLVASGDDPELKQWWQFLAYGAAKKIFEDSQDPEGVGTIMTEFENQEAFVLRRALRQNQIERTPTIYTEMTAYPYNNNQGRF